MHTSTNILLVNYLHEYPQVHITADLTVKAVFNNRTHGETTFRDISPRITTHKIVSAKPLATIIENDNIMDKLTIKVNMSGGCVILALFSGMKATHTPTLEG